MACVLLGWIVAIRGRRPPAHAGEPTAVQDERRPADLEARIAELIQQLGAPEYATRERAQVELQRLRLDAFDALNEAQFSDDIEIAMSARYLVQQHAGQLGQRR